MEKTPPRGAVTRSLGDLLRALLAGALLAGILGGIPYGLIRYVGWPLPDHLPTWDMLQQSIGVSTFIDTLAVCVWLAWAQFAVCVLAELRAAVSGRGWAVPIPAAGASQALARKLVTTMLLVSAGTMTLGQVASAATLPTQGAPVAAVAGAQSGQTTRTTVPADTSTTVIANTRTTTVSTTNQVLPAGTKLYTVQPPEGRHTDTLWDIAERHLGDGLRYKQILDLNRDRVQPDGSRLTNESLLRPGWQLVMPADATGPGLTVEQPAASTTETAVQTVTVHAGDTLSAIAQQALGDADRYPELTAANEGHAMPDGQTFRNPDLIFPGWTITIPQPAQAPTIAQSPALAAEQPTPQSSATTPTTPSVPPAVATPAPATPTTSSPAVTPSAAASAPAVAPSTVSAQQTPNPTDTAAASPTVSAAHEITTPAAHSSAVDVAAIASWGGLAAAGILTALGGKRMLQQRGRRRGQRIRMPQVAAVAAATDGPTDPVNAAAAKLADLERRLRATEDPTGADLVDRALRTLAARLGELDRPLPKLAALRLLPTSLDLYLQEDSAVEAVAPFTATTDANRWTCPSAGADLLAPEAARHVAAPYPALATLGRDGDDLILVDLEALGVLLLDADTARPFARALAIELASAPWRDDLGVSLIGLDEGLTALDSGYGRLQPVDTVADALAEIVSWTETVRDALARTNTPSIRHARTTSLTPDSWTPRIAVSAVPLTTADLDTAEHLAAEPLCGALIAPAASGIRPHIVRLPAPAGGPLTIGSLTLDLVVPQRITDDDFDTLMGLFGITTEAALDEAAPVVEAKTTEAAEMSTPAALTWVPSATQVPEQTELPLDLNDDDVELPETTGPVINLLGPVSITGVDPTAVPSAASVRLTEVAAWIALHPGGPMPQLTTDLSPSDPNATSSAGLVSALRRWLGNDDTDAPHLLPDTGEGLRFGPAVTSDWDRFLRLTARNTHQARRLALDLVDTRPFADVPPRRYIWAEGYRQQMIAAIVDVAEQVAEQCLDISDHRGALAAADTGIRVEPAAEALYRLAMQAAHLAGDRDQVEHYADTLETVLERLGAQMEPSTTELLRQLLSSGSYLVRPAP